MHRRFLQPRLNLGGLIPRQPIQSRLLRYLKGVIVLWPPMASGMGKLILIFYVTVVKQSAAQDGTAKTMTTGKI